jgi:branched-chain amino acid transport system permease protein
MPGVSKFWLGVVATLMIGLILSLSDIIANSFWFFAGYVVVQYVVLATAWNIMGGYMGYVNFGSAGFFAIGAYTSVVLYTLMKAPLLVMIPVSGLVCGLIGLGVGYLTLRLRGVYFAIGTLALAVVRRLCPLPVFRHAGAGGVCRLGRALDRTVEIRTRAARHPR